MQLKYLWVCCLIVLSACAGQVSPTPEEQPTSTLTLATETLFPTATPEATATPVPFFLVHGDAPIVSKGQPGAWDDRYTDPGAVIYYDGLFHMFRNGFRAFPAESQVGYVTSVDGYTWTKQVDDMPILTTQDVPYAKVAMYASSVIQEDNCWILFFYTWDSKSFPAPSVIGRAAECDDDSEMTHWSVDESPILQPGAKGSWDDEQVLAPHVLKTEEGYIMYYSGTNTSGIQQIGMALSKDGIHWTKYDDPDTTSQPFAESDPVFQPAEKGQWDSGWVHQPRVFQTAEGWVMIYRGVSDTRGAKMKLGLAISSDGIHWERYAGNPIFKPGDIKGAAQFWFTNAVLKDDVLYLFVEGDIHQSTQIYLATHEGGFVP